LAEIPHIVVDDNTSVTTKKNIYRTVKFHVPIPFQVVLLTEVESIYFACGGGGILSMIAGSI
jgi:hypothetical protein